MSPDGGDQHRFADALFVLDAGPYHVCATPWTGDGPSSECDRAEADALVMSESTSEIVLVSQCHGSPKGGLDVVSVLNDPPRIDGLTILDSKFIGVCEQATITVTASDPNGDALTYDWRVTDAPTGEAPALTPAGPTATFTPKAAGDYQLTVTVTDVHAGASSLTFPIHVGGAGGASSFGCLDQEFSGLITLGVGPQGNPMEGGPQSLFGQTYTAGLAGTLGGVAIRIHGQGQSCFLRVRIFGAANDLPTGPPLGEAIFDVLAPSLDDVLTFPVAIAQTPGSQYAIIIDCSTPLPPFVTGPVWAGSGNELADYPGGQAVFSGDGGTSWEALGAHGVAGDLHFRTYVQPGP